MKQETLEEALPKNRWKYVGKQETLEYGLLQHIKFCLECGNEAQAIRLIEKYGFEMQEQGYSEEEVYSIIRMCLGMKESGKTDIEIMEQFKQFKNK
jgi:hypothetical protein